MAIDEPIDYLRNQIELEDSSRIPFVEPVSEFASLTLSLIPQVPLGFKEFFDWVQNHAASRSEHRIKVMIDTCFDELKSLNVRLDNVTATLQDIIADAAERASRTRSEERIKRIGLILAHGISAFKPAEADEIEEMMRVASELTELDVVYLAKLVEMEGSVVRARGRIERYEAQRRWEDSQFGRRIDPEVESVFAKLAGYGVVWRLPSQNNVNSGADVADGYGLLPKGLRFIELIKHTSS